MAREGRRGGRGGASPGGGGGCAVRAGAAREEAMSEGEIEERERQSAELPGPADSVHSRPHRAEAARHSQPLAVRAAHRGACTERGYAARCKMLFVHLMRNKLVPRALYYYCKASFAAREAAGLKVVLEDLPWMLLRAETAPSSYESQAFHTMVPSTTDPS